jgi:hypothetical protein
MEHLTITRKKENKTNTVSNKTMQEPADKGIDKRNKKFLNALHYISSRDPGAFERVAPELLHRTLWELRGGADPIFSEKLDYWIEAEHKWKDFADVFSEEQATAKPKKRVDDFELTNEDIDILQKLEDRFYGDFHRWDTIKRHQFIILGIIALHGTKGAKQGDLIEGLGSNFERTSLEGSNAIRATKVALSRLLRPYNVFGPSLGHGVNRLHKIEDEHFARILSLFIMQQKASILLPTTLDYEFDIELATLQHYGK